MRITIDALLIGTAAIGFFTLMRWLTTLLLHAAAKLWKVRPRRRDKLGQLEHRLDSLEQRMQSLEDTSKRIVELLEGTRVAA